MPAAPDHKLLRILGVGFAVAVIVGAVIGVGILRTPGEVAAHLASAPLILAMWLAGGIYALLAAMSVTELGTMLPESGGYFVFSRRAFGDAVGFTVGWTDWIGQTSAIAYASVAFSEFFTALFPALVGREAIIAVTVIAAFGLLQWSGIRASSRVQQITSLVKAIAFLALVVACFLYGGNKSAGPQPVRGEPLLVSIVLAAQAIILTYDGWYEALYFTEEIGKLGRITDDGDIKEYDVPNPAGTPNGVGSGPVGNDVWFTGFTDDRIGRLTVDCRSAADGSSTCRQP